MTSPPGSRYAPLAVLCLDLVRSADVDEQPEAVVAGAGQALCWMAVGRPAVGKAVWEAGFLEVFQATMRRCSQGSVALLLCATAPPFHMVFVHICGASVAKTAARPNPRYNPMERIGRQDLIPTGILCAFKDVVEGAQAEGVEVIQPLLDAGALDIAISSLTAYQVRGSAPPCSLLSPLRSPLRAAYPRCPLSRRWPRIAAPQMLGKPAEASVGAIQWGALYTLEILLGSAQAQPVVVANYNPYRS